MTIPPVNFKRPSRDETLYRGIVDDGFEAFPARKDNYQRFQNRDVNSPVVDYMPVMMDIEPNSHCNLRCSMCLLSSMKGKRAESMSLEDFKEFIDGQPGLLEIKLQGLGEPMLLGDRFIEMIRYAREKRLWVRSTTNASLPAVNRNYQKLLDSDICEIQVSVDGCSQKTYEDIRKGGNFDLVRKNCILLNDYGARIDKSRTRMWSLIQESNFHEIREFPPLAAELGFRRLTLAMIGGWNGDISWTEKNRVLNVEDRFTPSLFKELYDVAEHHAVDLSFWGNDGKYNKDNICNWPFYRAYISSDLKIVPCCAICDPAVVNLGDARQFEKVWFGERFKALRQAHLNRKIPSYCSNCYQ